MVASLHNCDKINDSIQTAMKTKFPVIEVKMVPTTFKHGLTAKKRVTHVVSFKADWKQLNEAREALVTIFQHSAANLLPNEIFFVPSPTNGMISQEMYYDFAHAHDHESMSSIIRSFAILNAKILSQPEYHGH